MTIMTGICVFSYQVVTVIIVPLNTISQYTGILFDHYHQLECCRLLRILKKNMVSKGVVLIADRVALGSIELTVQKYPKNFEGEPRFTRPAVSHF
jgi:hypothetical protein